MEKLDLRVVPAFFPLLLHTALCTPDRAEAYLEPAGWQAGRVGERKNVRREGALRYFSIHISTVAFLVYFTLHPQKPFSCLKFESLHYSLRSDYRCSVHVSYMLVSS